MRQYNRIYIARRGAVDRLLFGFAFLSCLVALWRPPCAWAEEAGPETEAIMGARYVSGTVFLDKNENGTCDAGEPGLPGIRLLAGHKVSVTDTEGRYSILHPEPFQVVSLSFPSGMWPTAGWFRRMTRANETSIDFGLRKEDQALPFFFVQFTDPHGDHPRTMPMMHAECDVLPLKPKFYICTGDMRSGDPSVRNIPDLLRSFGQIGRNFAEFGAPLFMVPGNHDTVGYGGTGKQAVSDQDVRHPLFANGCWERYVCPSHWSFAVANVHFFGLEYAQHIDNRWHQTPSDTAAWLSNELETLPMHTRTVLCAHSPSLGKLAIEHDMTLALVGDSHTEGVFYRPGQEKPEFPDNVLVGGFCQSSHKQNGRHYCQDGRPSGYRMVVVETDRIDTFYRALGEERTIMVNRPRRHVTQQAEGKLIVQGQFFDSRGEVTQVVVRLDQSERIVPFVRRRLWSDFSVELDTRELEDGFHSLAVTTKSPAAEHTLEEPYLIMTGRQNKFTPKGNARIIAKVSSPAAAVVLVNGQSIGQVEMNDEGAMVSLEIPAGMLRRLNRIGLNGPGKLSDVRLEYGGREFVDQHRIFSWLYTPILTQKAELYFDLSFPGPPVRWQITQAVVPR